MRTKQLAQLTAILLVLGAGQLVRAGDMDEHAGHKMMTHPSVANVVRADYSLPDLELVDSNGRTVRLHDVLNEQKPVIVNFIFTTCTTICPVITATTLQLQKEFGEGDIIPQFVTISIDPDYDSAEVMRAYAKKYGADWTFLTGSPANIMTTLQAFDAYRGNKVNHFALNIMRPAGDEQWTRVEGLTSAAELARVWRNISL